MPEVLMEYLSDGIGVLTLSEPQALNAMDEAMAEVFRAQIKELRSANLRVLILTGAGKAFSAGGNLEMLATKVELSKKKNKKKMLEFYESFLCIRELGVPLIAAVNGHAIGAGLCLAMACDIRVISKDAKLGMTFTKLGLHPGMGGTWLFPRVLGYAAAAELLLTGRVVSGDDVVRFGLSREVVPGDEVLPRAKQIAEEIASCGPLATQQLLMSLRNTPLALEDALIREAECQSENYAHHEFMEGISAAKEKRRPNFAREE